MFPSASASAELNSFNNHFIRHVEEQINQLQPEKPNIIAVEAHNWMLLPIGFEPLYTRIQRFFADRKELYLSGVVVLRSNRKSAYLNNDYATESSRLAKEDVEKLDFKWR